MVPFLFILSALITINITNAQDNLTHWTEGAPNMPHPTCASAVGYCDVTGHVYSIGGFGKSKEFCPPPFDSNYSLSAVEDCYGVWKLDMNSLPDSNWMFVQNISDTMFYKPYQPPVSTVCQINNTIYFCHVNDRYQQCAYLGMYDMEKEIYYQEYIDVTQVFKQIDTRCIDITSFTCDGISTLYFICYTSYGYENKFFLYDLNTKQISNGAMLKYAFPTYHGLYIPPVFTYSNGYIVIFNQADVEREITKIQYIYKDDMGNNETFWKISSVGLPEGRWALDGPMTIGIDNMFYLLGGKEGQTADVLVYNLIQDTLHQSVPLLHGTYWDHPLIINKAIYYFGGSQYKGLTAFSTWYYSNQFS